MALEWAVNRQFPADIRGPSLALMRDHGCQATATALRRAYGTLGLLQALTSDHHPQGHADTQRVRRTRNAECRWLTAWTGPCELITALEGWIADANEPDLYAALQLWAISRPDRLSGKTIGATALRSRSLDTWGALQAVDSRVKVPGSIRSNPRGCMGNGLWWNLVACSP